MTTKTPPDTTRENQPACFEPRPNLKHEFVGELEAIQTRSRLWAAIPKHIGAEIRRYLDSHIRPGPSLLALLSGDAEEARRRADAETQNAMLAITAWLCEDAPPESWGAPELVVNWLNAKPIAMTGEELENTDNAITQDL